MCAAVAGPVRSVNPKAEPYAKEKLKVSVSVSNEIPEPISFPEPVLFVIAGVSFSGLRPTALSVPAGERSNVIIAAREIARVDASASIARCFDFIIL